MKSYIYLEQVELIVHTNIGTEALLFNLLYAGF